MGHGDQDRVGSMLARGRPEQRVQSDAIRAYAHAGPAENAGMNPLRTADVTARVVTWHNRHPLARRITPADVSGIGIVALPFALKAPTGAGAVAAAPAELTPIFGDDWMFHAAPKRLGDWVRRHGVYPLVGATHWPLRQIDADLPLARRADAQGLEGRTVRHLVTAVIDVAGQRVRVLLAPQGSMRNAAMFGSRVFSLPRISALAGGSAALGLAFGLLPGLHAGGATPEAAPIIASAASAASAPESGAASTLASASAAASTSATMLATAQEGSPAASTALSGPGLVAAASPAPAARTPSPTEPADPAAEPASSAAPHAASPAKASPSAPAPSLALARATADILEPADVSPEVRDRASGAAPLVRIRPVLTEDERREARLRSASLRPAGGASAALPAKGPVYAIVTPGLRTRTDAEAQQVLLQGLMAQTATPVPTHLDVMAAKGRWRVVWWPHPQQRQAEQLLLEARARGLKVELIAF